MAKKTKKSSGKSESNDTDVVRIRASANTTSKSKKVAETVVDSPAKKLKSDKKTVKAKKVKKVRTRRKAPRALSAPGGYFKGAWVELRQVRWPNRRATWGMTAAVMAYTAFFVIFVILLDAGFKYLFELMLKN